MSDAAVNAAIRRLSFDTQRGITGHDFRHVAASLLCELGYRDGWVEEALEHKKGGIAGASIAWTFSEVKRRSPPEDRRDGHDTLRRRLTSRGRAIAPS
jgi:integrase